jgi:signal transduction histidine kinase
MNKQLFIPLRFKILISLLLGITVVVGAITFTMANLFHTDKTAYINDLISTNTIHTAKEANSLIEVYSERIKTISKVAYDAEMAPDEKSKMLDDLFQGFPEMLAITFYEDGVENASVFDEGALTDAGLSKADLDIYLMENSILGIDFDPEEVFIRNSTFNEALPIMTMTTRMMFSELESELVLEAMIRIDRLMSVVDRSELFEAFILEPDGRLLVHKDPERIAAHGFMGWMPDTATLPEKSNLATTHEYTMDGVEMIGGFTQLEAGNLIVAAQIPKAAAFLSARQLFNNLIFVSFIILLAATAISLIWSYRITRPLVSLTRAAQDVGKGDFEVQLKPTSRDEIGSLTQSVNQMAHELGEREKALEDAQAALIQSEKMSAFGQLSAGIAHEVKNPLAGILGYTQLSLKKMEDNPDIYKNLKIIEQETRRCNSIVENLMKFARQDKLELKPLVLNDVIEDSLVLVDHQMGISQVQMEKNLAEGLPNVKGDANQLIQVLMNLLINAQQAMDGKPGTITITSSSPNAGVVEIKVADTGPGMPEETSSKIFEPFFTTKASGKGTGLGLAVTYGIIKDHGGNIRVESQPGDGATFIITFPVTTGGTPQEDASPESPEDTLPSEDTSAESLDDIQQSEAEDG